MQTGRHFAICNSGAVSNPQLLSHGNLTLSLTHKHMYKTELLLASQHKVRGIITLAYHHHHHHKSPEGRLTPITTDVCHVFGMHNSAAILYRMYK